MLTQRVKQVFPDEWDDKDKVMYDSMIANGKNILGNQLAHDEAFILDMAARMTINQKKGYKSVYTDDEIKQIKQNNVDAFESGTNFQTPYDEWHDSSENPINWTDEKLNAQYRNPNEDDVTIEMSNSSVNNE